MKAICVDEKSEGFPLRWEDVPDPVCGAGEVLVDIHATAVNRADLMQRQGNYPPPSGMPPYMGLEMSGVIAELGEGVTNWQVGDRVCALLSGGGYAERVAVPQELLIRIPNDWDFVKAAAVPEVFYTAFVNLFIEAGLQEGETVLIHGGGSGVGTAGIQMAREAGCRVLVTAGTEEKLDRCKELGAEFGVNYKERDFAEAILEAYPDGVDVILDIAGSDYLARNIELLKLRGRLVIIALLTGATAEINLSFLMRKRLRVIGSVLRSRSLEEKAAIAQQFEQRFWPLLVNGTIEPVIFEVVPITQAEAAQDILAQNRNTGKVIMAVRDE
ncbi:MAG: NAD(P)H-quinone oxidoreductase [bacterium]|nr:NAD(P)H-quinone oxidoreductase [bacterium]